jgi:hypothetical protein
LHVERHVSDCLGGSLSTIDTRTCCLGARIRSGVGCCAEESRTCWTGSRLTSSLSLTSFFTNFCLLLTWSPAIDFLSSNLFLYQFVFRIFYLW